MEVHAQDNCASPSSLCSGSSKTGTTVLASFSGSDPVLSCGDGVVQNSVWFTVLAINNGTCQVTVNNINNTPGLDMEIYTGACGSLVSIGQCASGSGAGGGSMSITFPTVMGTNYFIMVDGSSGNQEAFNIVATSTDDAIVARPDANFDVNPASGCTPLIAVMDNTTTLHGGTNTTFDWKIDAGAFFPSSGADTTMTFSIVDTASITLRVCNLQCGCKSVSQEVIVQDLRPVIDYNPLSTCIGTNINFDGSATIQPPPSFDPNITDWGWDFGDPASGPANTANGQNVSHTFNGPGPSYTVRLIVQGICGPDTAYQVITLLPEPVVTISGPTQICEGTDLNLTSTVSNVNPPVTYDWIGAGSYSCTNCDATTISGLPTGGPYSILLSIIDSLGCLGDTTIDVIVNDVPTVFAGGFIIVCSYDSAQLNAVPSGGLPPYQYAWTPPAGLSNDTIANPVTYNTAASNYCVVVTDANGCPSNPDCVTINQYPVPSVTPGSANLCSSQSNMQNTFTVTGASPGSTYSWTLSPDYGLITAAAPDSSDVTATFPPVAATYNFVVIVADAVTGCTDTVPVSFTVTAGLSMNIVGPSQLCVGDSATLSVSGATTYSWTASPSIVFADSTASTQVVSPPVTTIFTIIGTMGTCTQTITDTLNVSPKPVAVIDSIPPFCGCATAPLNGVGSTPGMTYQWVSQNGNIINAPTNIVTTAQICGLDSIFLTVTDPTSLCFSNAAVSTSARPNPDAHITVLPNLICNGTSTLINLNATGSNTDLLTTYHWSSSDLSVVIADTAAYPNTSATVSTVNVFYLTVTDSTGCDSTVSDTVRIYPPPSLSADLPFLCTSDPVLQSTLSVTGASGGSIYTWDTIPGCAVPSTSSSSSQLFDFAACPPAVYSFTVTVDDPADTCTTVLSATVTVVSGVSLVVSNDTSFCEGGIATLVASGANSFSWSSGELTDTIVVDSLTAAGSPYDYIVTGTIGSCSATDTVTVTVNPVPVTSPICCDSVVCENDPASNYFVAPPTANTYNWTVTGGVILVGQTTPNLVVTWNTIGLGNVSVQEVTSLGCAGALQALNVIINPLPDTPTVSGLDTVCANSLATYFVTPNAGSTYFWSVTGGALTTGTSGAVNSVLWGNGGTGTINVTETSSAGCTSIAAVFNVQINVRPIPVSVSGGTIVCDNIQEIYTVNASPGSVYTWTILNDTFDTLNASTDTMTVDWGIPGTGHVIIFETNSFGCNSDTSDIPVTVNQHPITQIPTDSATICNNTPYQIVANSTSGVHWSTDGSGTFNDSTVASAIYIPSNSDTGYIHLMMIASNPPCLDDTAWLVLYHTPSPIVTITGPAAPICYGTMDTLRATGGGNYVWTPGGIPFAEIGIRPLTTTTYTLAVTNGYNCTTYDSITVTVIPPGIPDAGLDVTLCIGDTAFLTGTQQNAGGLQWSTLGDGIFLPDSSSSTVSYVPGVSDTTINAFDIVLVTTGACLNLTDTLHMVIQHHPYINAGNDTTISSEPTAAAIVTLSPILVNVSALHWTTNGTGTFSPSDTSLNATYEPSAADYNLPSISIFVTSTGSCAPAIDTIVVELAPFIIPNIFTPYPTSPGYNDYFVIRYLTPHCTLKIWDRWGNLVYTTDYYQNDWDAHGLKADLYYYLVVSEDDEKYKGWVQVLKD